MCIVRNVAIETQKNTNLLKVNIVRKLHVLRVDAENLETASGVGDTNVDLTIEATETTEGGVDGVRTVSRSHNDNIGAGLEAIHERQQLGHDTPLDFTVRLHDALASVCQSNESYAPSHASAQ